MNTFRAINLYDEWKWDDVSCFVGRMFYSLAFFVLPLNMILPVRWCTIRCSFDPIEGTLRAIRIFLSLFWIIYARFFFFLIFSGFGEFYVPALGKQRLLCKSLFTVAKQRQQHRYFGAKCMHQQIHTLNSHPTDGYTHSMCVCYDFLRFLSQLLFSLTQIVSHNHIWT